MLKRHSLYSAWSRPTAQFLMKAAALLGVFLLLYRDDLVGRFLDPWAELTARLTVALLHILKVEAVRIGTEIHHPGGFAYEIYYRCTGVLPAALLTAFTVASPAPLRSKLVGLSVGIPVLIVLNVVRLIHLFHTGVHHPALFGVTHGVVWELILIMATLGLWWMWSRRAIRSHPPR